MALTALNGWDEYKVTRKVLGSLGTVLFDRTGSRVGTW